MSSHFAKLREELDAKENKLKQQRKKADEVAELTKQLEEKKRALADMSEGLDGQSDDVTVIKKRIEILSNLAAPLDAAMKSKTTSGDVVQHVLEAAISSGHLTCDDIVQRTVKIGERMVGRTRGDVLDEILLYVVVNDQDLRAAISAAMANHASVEDVLKCALTLALRKRGNAADLLESVAKTAYDMLGDKATAAEPIKETPIGTVTPTQASFTVKLISQVQPVNLPKENGARGSQSPAVPDNKNGLRGQAVDFKPSNTPNGNHRGGNQNGGNPNGGNQNGGIQNGGNKSGGGWEVFARENGAGNVSENGASTGQRGWGSIPGWGL